MKILVTGAAGFIGANLVRRLLTYGHEVYGIDNFFSSSKENLEDLKKEKAFNFFEADIVDGIPNELNDVGIDQIYHLACPASPPRYQADHIYTLRTNFEGTLNVLEFAKKNGAKILFSSTSEVYGDPLSHPQKESYRGNVSTHGVRSCYDEGKRVAESLCMNMWRMYDLPVRIVRIFNTYGPYMDPNDGRVVSNFIVAALKEKPLEIYGDGSQTRSFQYIDDLLDGMIAYMKLDENFPGPINLGNTQEFSILELKESLEEILGLDLEVKMRDLPLDDPVRRKPDISLAGEKLGWKPGISLKDGLKKTIGYFKSKIVS